MDFNNEAIETACKEKKVVIFDNADLYLTNELLKCIKADLVLVSVKNAETFNVQGSYKYYINSGEGYIEIKGW
jgi:hypothetical protein